LYGLKSCTWESAEALQLLDALISTIFARAKAIPSTISPGIQKEMQNIPYSEDFESRYGVAMTSQGLGSCFIGVQNLFG
jgi:hypothetical protein